MIPLLFSVPIDHTFFLANFCTASLASSSMASFLPRQPSGGGAYPNNTRYENKKINGAIAPNGAPPQQQSQQQQQQPPQQQQQPQQAQPAQQQQQPPPAITMDVRTKPPPTSQQVRPSGNTAVVQQPQDQMNGIGISNVVPAGGTGGGNPVDFGGMYSNAGSTEAPGLEKYLDSSRGPNGGRVPTAPTDMTNGMYGQHELVAAISQITADQTASNSAAQQAKAYNKTRKWPESGGQASGAGNGGQPPGKPDTGEPAPTNAPRGFGSRPPTATGGSRPPNTRYSGGNAGQGPDLSVANDGASDSLSSTSEEVVTTNAAAAVAIAGELGDNGKPLSFARIASLNLEKQAVHRPRKAMQMVAPENSDSAAVAAVAAVAQGGVGGGGIDSQGNYVSMAAAQAGMVMPPHSNPGLATMAMAEAVAAAQHGMASMHGGPYPNHAMAHHMAAMAAQMPIVPLPPTNNPRFFFDIAMDGKRLGRAIIEVHASVAPKMAQNFHMLATHEKSFGYRGCHFFQAWRNESVICGDWEHNSGRGGRAALDDGPLFTPDETKLPCIRGAVGMRRMSKKHSSLNQVIKEYFAFGKTKDN